MKDRFTTPDIEKICSIAKPRLREWIVHNYVPPASIQEAKGQGSKNIYSLEDVYGVALLKYLIEDVRLAREEAARIVHTWKKTLDLFNLNPKSDRYLFFKRFTKNDGEKDIAYSLIKSPFYEKEHAVVDIEFGEVFYPTTSEFIMTESGEGGIEYSYDHEANRAACKEIIESQNQREWDTLMVINIGKIMDDIDNKIE